MKSPILFSNIGKDRSYKEVWDLQESLLKKNVSIKSTAFAEQENNASTLPEIAETTHYLLFVEHSPVYTLGKSGNENHVLISPQMREEKGIEFFKINRGGDITFHGPGQLVGYPILDLDKFKTDLGWYLRSLEEVVILTLEEYGLKGERSKGETGVWLDTNIKGRERKICAMGIRCSRWITMHGFALNINTDLQYFNHIIPCGIQNKQVTSLAKELGREVSMNEVIEKMKRNFEKVFDAEIKNVE